MLEHISACHSVGQDIAILYCYKLAVTGLKHDMSILSNLLAFSSLNSSADKQNRSLSVSGRFIFESNMPPVRSTASKSLDKMDLLSSKDSSKIDPRHRVLLRLFHSFGMKVRKHYYAFFVVLETMQKKDCNINQIDEIKSEKVSQRMQSAINKMSQTINVLSLKLFQKREKNQCFYTLKQRSKHHRALETISHVVEKGLQRTGNLLFLSQVKSRHMMSMRIQILLSTLYSVVVEKIGRSQMKDLQAGFRKIISGTRVNNRKQLDVGRVKPENKLAKPVKQIKVDLTILKDVNKVPVHNNRSDECSFKSSPRGKTSLPDSSAKYASSPFKPSKIMTTLIDSVAVDNLQCQAVMSTAYKVTTDCMEPPLDRHYQCELIPKMLIKKTPDELLQDQVGDLFDRSNIFREFRGSKNRVQNTDRAEKESVSGIDELDISSAVGESFLRIESMINDMEKMRGKEKQEGVVAIGDAHKGQGYFLSSFGSIDPTNEKHTPSFGTDPVNFKNSLVVERESMNEFSRQRQTAKQHGILKHNPVFVGMNKSLGFGYASKPRQLERQVGTTKGEIRKDNHQKIPLRSLRTKNKKNSMQNPLKQSGADEYLLIDGPEQSVLSSFNKFTQNCRDRSLTGNGAQSEQKSKSRSFNHENSATFICRKLKLMRDEDEQRNQHKAMGYCRSNFVNQNFRTLYFEKQQSDNGVQSQEQDRQTKFNFYFPVEHETAILKQDFTPVRDSNTNEWLSNQKVSNRSSCLNSTRNEKQACKEICESAVTHNKNKVKIPNIQPIKQTTYPPKKFINLLKKT